MAAFSTDVRRELQGWERRSFMREPLHAVIHKVPGRATPGMLDVCGRPLIARQLDWLLHAGCDCVIVEVDGDDASLAVVRWIGEHHGLGTDVLLAPSSSSAWARGALRELTMRVGISSQDALLAVPADMLSDMQVRRLVPLSNAYGVVAVFDAPEELRAGRHGCHSLDGGTIRLVRAPMRRGPTTVHGPGWAVRLQSASDAAVLSRWMWTKSREDAVSYRGCA